MRDIVTRAQLELERAKTRLKVEILLPYSLALSALLFIGTIILFIVLVLPTLPSGKSSDNYRLLYAISAVLSVLGGCLFKEIRYAYKFFIINALRESQEKGHATKELADAIVQTTRWRRLSIKDKFGREQVADESNHLK